MVDILGSQPTVLNIFVIQDSDNIPVDVYAVLKYPRVQEWKLKTYTDSQEIVHCAYSRKESIVTPLRLNVAPLPPRFHVLCLPPGSENRREQSINSRWPKKLGEHEDLRKIPLAHYP
ncbi:unnamed protein product [Dibothriocephalus latus]|uniref:Uncharacterized protein n=1 Tax=Dibothriocephalus latus TaxID=60516 RepID=A0A3P7PXI3_DIBLA|nr:unnamed protein product [Dibothriocephalus latus]